MFSHSFDEYEPLKAQGATVIDVRTIEEFEDDHAPQAINIPLDQLEARLEEIQALPTPLALCCRSGSRSATAKQLLKSCNIHQVFNIGPWQAAL